METSRIDFDKSQITPEAVTTPVGTSIIDFDISENPAVLERHVMIYADRPHASERAMVIAEDRLAAEDQVVVFGLNEHVFGLAQKFPIARFGGSAHNIVLESADGRALGKYAVDNGDSMAIQFDGMEPETVSSVINGFLREMLKAPKRPITLVFVGLDEMLPRKRHQDRLNATAFRSILTRGPEKELKVVATSVSPQAAPIEASEHMFTKIVGRSTIKKNIEAIGALLDGRLIKYRDESYGLRCMGVNHQFIWPNTLAMAHMPFYSPLRQLQTNSGPGSSCPVDNTTPAEKKIVKAIKKAREAARNEAAKNTPGARRLRAVEARLRSAKTGKELHNQTPSRPNEARCDIARVMESHRISGLLKTDDALDQARVLDLAQNDPNLSHASRYAARAYSTLKNLGSVGMISGAYAIALMQDQSSAEDFFEALAGRKDGIVEADTTARRLSDLGESVAKRSQERFDVILEGWTDFVASRRSTAPKLSAANDDDTLSAAV